MGTIVCGACGTRSQEAVEVCGTCGTPLAPPDAAPGRVDAMDWDDGGFGPAAGSSFDEEFDPALSADDERPVERPAPGSAASAEPQVGEPTAPAATRPRAAATRPPAAATRPPAAGEPIGAVRPATAASRSATTAPIAAKPTGAMKPTVAAKPTAAVRPAAAGRPAPPPTAAVKPTAPRTPPSTAAVKPTTTRGSPPPPRVTAPEERIAPGDVVCRNCGAANSPERRFCRRCGRPLPSAPVGASRGAPAQPSHRERLADPEHRAAHRRYRRSLGLRSRAFRVVTGVLAVAGLAAVLGIGGLQPGPWLRDRWNEWRPDRYVVIEEVTATTEPAELEARDLAARFVVDKSPDNAWATTWDGTPSRPADQPAACGDPTTGAGAAALVLTLPQPTDVTRVGIGGGLPAEDPQRNSFWRPTGVELSFSDGTCQRHALEDVADLQHFSVDVKQVQWMRLEVVAALAPEVGEDQRVAVHRVVLSTHH